jgi:sec-independent protein translocase protein TatA
MGTFSIWHIVIFAGVALLLFGGGGKISDLMGDVAKGVTSFRAGLKDADRAPPVTPSLESRETPAGMSQGGDEVRKV